MERQEFFTSANGLVEINRMDFDEYADILTDNEWQSFADTFGEKYAERKGKPDFQFEVEYDTILNECCEVFFSRKSVATKVGLIKSIKEMLAELNADEVSLDSITCREGVLLSLNANGVVRVVKVWKVQNMSLEEICPYGLTMIKNRLNEIDFKLRIGFSE